MLVFEVVNFDLAEKTLKKQTGMMAEQCVTCREQVNSEDKAILCEMCESWEHVVCIEASERPSEALYNTMVSCRSKAVMFTCTSCLELCSMKWIAHAQTTSS